MPKLKERISSVQLFFLLFFYMLSGFILHGGSSFTIFMFAVLFCVCVCIICTAVCKNLNSFAELSESLLGGYARILRISSAIITAFPLVQTILAIYSRISRYYGKETGLFIIPAIAVLCVISVSRGFVRAARFAELCAFPLAMVIPLSLLGGGGGGFTFAAHETELFVGFSVIGSVPVFFSLYLRTVDGEGMSDYAKSSAFHPSSLACGVGAAALAGCVHMFLRFSGAESILSTFLLCFFFIARMIAISISLCDMLEIAECEDMRSRTGKTVLLCFIIAVVFFFYTFFPRLSSEIVTVCNVIFPCLAFAVLMLKRGYVAD